MWMEGQGSTAAEVGDMVKRVEGKPVRESRRDSYGFFCGHSRGRVQVALQMLQEAANLVVGADKAKKNVVSFSAEQDPFTQSHAKFPYFFRKLFDAKTSLDVTGRECVLKFFDSGDDLRFPPRIEAGKKLAEDRGGAEGHLEAFQMRQEFCPTFEAFQPLASFQTFLIPMSHPGDGLVAQAFARRQFQYPRQRLEQLRSFVPIQGGGFFNDVPYGGRHVFSFSVAPSLYHRRDRFSSHLSQHIKARVVDMAKCKEGQPVRESQRDSYGFFYGRSPVEKIWGWALE